MINNHSQGNKSEKLHVANAVDKSCQSGFPDWLILPLLPFLIFFYLMVGDNY